MGRPSKLTDAQWSEVERRLLAGETARALGREFGLSETAIRKKYGANQSVSLQSSQVRSAAVKVAEANTALEALPAAQRVVAVGLAEQLRSISTSYASAAELGAKTAHRFFALANAQAQKVDDANPLSAESIEAMKGISVLTKVGNDSLMPASSLLSANREAAAKANTPPEEDNLPPQRERIGLDAWKQHHGLA